MDKTTQNLIWSCLPHEYKKEVKRQYRIATNGNQYFTQCTLEYLFGYHNLTSDAEGEEMLTIKKSKAQYRFQYAREEVEEDSDYYNGYAQAIYDLFGSKCLPDEACNVASSDVASNVASSKPKPAEPKKSRCEQCGVPNSSICAHMNCQDYKPQSEPKFKYNVGDEVKYKLDGKAYKIAFIDKGLTALPYQLKNGMWVSESDLEPYTEPNFRKGDKFRYKKNPGEVYIVDPSRMMVRSIIGIRIQMA